MKKPNYLQKNVPYMLAAAFVTGLVFHYPTYMTTSISENIGLLGSSLIILVGIPVGIIWLTKLFRKNKSWSKGEIRTAWTVQIFFSILILAGKFI